MNKIQMMIDVFNNMDTSTLVDHYNVYMIDENLRYYPISKLDSILREHNFTYEDFFVAVRNGDFHRYADYFQLYIDEEGDMERNAIETYDEDWIRNIILKKDEWGHLADSMAQWFLNQYDEIYFKRSPLISEKIHNIIDM